MAAKNADKLQLQGFTRVWDVGGNEFGLKRAIDERLYPGPRIYPSGAMISQTSGHADFKGYTDVPSEPGAPLTCLERNGEILLADGVPEVMKRVREVLRMGATQIKLAAGGGVASDFDPIDVAEFTYEEIKAAVAVDRQHALRFFVRPQLTSLDKPSSTKAHCSWIRKTEIQRFKLNTRPKGGIKTIGGGAVVHHSSRAPVINRVGRAPLPSSPALRYSCFPDCRE